MLKSLKSYKMSEPSIFIIPETESLSDDRKHNQRHRVNFFKSFYALGSEDFAFKDHVGPFAKIVSLVCVSLSLLTHCSIFIIHILYFIIP